jgi:hypothetical protein
VVWYRVKGYTTFMDVNMGCESDPVHSVVWYNVMVWHSDCGFFDPE